MLFSSFIFFIFLIPVVALFHIIRNSNGKKSVLLIFSYGFYAYWDWKFCALLAFVTIANYYLCSSISFTDRAEKKKKMFYLALSVNIAVLLFFKYFNFFAFNVNSLFSFFGSYSDFLHLRVIVPLGVSFYIFQSISYSIDVYSGRFVHSKSLTDYALYISFFPKLIAGPIERASNLIPQFEKMNRVKKVQIEEGIYLITIGLFRKVLIGDTAGRFADHIFGNIQFYTSVELMSALLLYSVQIYADFSGYTHIARGTSKLFGIELVKNFEQPYFSKNITEFWRRWHISLSSWLRDYIFLPLSYSISRKLPEEKYYGIKTEYFIYVYSTMITFTICGFWHGASWNFVIWGFLHGLFLSLHRIILVNRRSPVAKIIKKLNSSARLISSVAFTYLSVLNLWLFFRLPDINSVREFLSGIMAVTKSEHTGLFLSINFIYLSVLATADYLEIKTVSHTVLGVIKNRAVKYGITAGLLTVIFVYIYQSNTSPFIYLQF
jgi:alginate O-acetyltransferase complex protein AlgI